LLPQALKEAGYRTAIVGKWHLGHADRKYWPRQRGFDYQYGPLLGEIDYFTHSAHGVRDWFHNNQPVNEPGYVTQLHGHDAARLIAAHDPKTPLFLYLAFTAPHSPYQVPKQYLDRYAHVADPSRRAYAAMITAMDDEIDRVLRAFEKRKMREHTLIVFQSDNGGPRSAKFTGEVDMSKSTIPADNGPYRDGKASLYEGGTRVVALANWPGRIGPGSVIDRPIHMVDMYPTLAKLAGATLGKNKPLDGMDVWPTLGEGSPLRATRSCTTSSRSAPLCARGTGSSYCRQRSRPRSSSSTWRQMLRRRRILPTRIRRRWPNFNNGSRRWRARLFRH